MRKAPATRAAGRRKRQLQWGRNLTVAEGARGPLGAPSSDLASMGPQLDSCGRLLVPADRLPRRLASMGPQLDSCGRPFIPPRPRRPPDASMGPQLDSCGRLFGRRQRPDAPQASMGPQPGSCGRLGRPRIRHSGQPELQWGRNLAAAEGGSARSCDSSCCAHFNGAAQGRTVLRQTPLLSQKDVTLSPPPPIGGPAEP